MGPACAPRGSSETRVHVCAQLEVESGLPRPGFDFVEWGHPGCRVLEGWGETERRDAGVVSWVGHFGGAELSQGKCLEVS